MYQLITTGCSIPDFCQHYGDYLFRVRGLSASTRKLHRYVVCRFLTFRLASRRESSAASIPRPTLFLYPAGILTTGTRFRT